MCMCSVSGTVIPNVILKSSRNLEKLFKILHSGDCLAESLTSSFCTLDNIGDQDSGGGWAVGSYQVNRGFGLMTPLSWVPGTVVSWVPGTVGPLANALLHYSYNVFIADTRC